MNEHALLHIPDSNYCFPVKENQVILRLRTMKGEKVKKIIVLYACKYHFHEAREEMEMKKSYSDRLYDYYEAKLQLDDVRLAYVFYLITDSGNFYYSEDGLTTTYDFNLGFYNFFQLPYINKEDVLNTVDWMRSAVFYQIFVDRFCRGKEDKDDSYINLTWGEIPNSKSFAGGDLCGIITKLDYIFSLGVNTIYLTPIFLSISNHKYDTIDYKKVDPQFGTNEDFAKLVKEIHKRGGRIVLDAVFNHCSNQMIQFQDVIKNGKNSRYYDWFIIEGDKVSTDPCNYECFATCDYMPKLNTVNKEVRKFLIDIACFWIREYDIDGWRLDVSDEISHGFWREFRREVKALKEDCVIIGENWHNAYPFLMGDQFDSIMNYAFTKANLDYFAFGALDTKEFVDKLNEILMRNKQSVNEMMLNLLDSHDTHRFLSEVKEDKDKLLAAIAIATCFLGTPCLFYGTEICMIGGYDPDCRRTFDWEESHWNQDVITTIRSLFQLRNDKALQEGTISITSNHTMFKLIRSLPDRSIELWYESGKEGSVLLDELKEDIKILVQHGYEKQHLRQKGFLIIERSKL